MPRANISSRHTPQAVHRFHPHLSLNTDTTVSDSDIEEVHAANMASRKNAAPTM